MAAGRTEVFYELKLWPWDYAAGSLIAQEAGGVAIWIEELYIKPSYRACGYGSRFLREFLGSLPPQVKRVRLEAERENDRAVRLYESLGFTFLDYDQMVIER